MQVKDYIAHYHRALPVSHSAFRSYTARMFLWMDTDGRIYEVEEVVDFRKAHKSNWASARQWVEVKNLGEVPGKLVVYRDVEFGIIGVGELHKFFRQHRALTASKAIAGLRHLPDADRLTKKIKRWSFKWGEL